MKKSKKQVKKKVKKGKRNSKIYKKKREEEKNWLWPLSRAARLEKNSMDRHVLRGWTVALDFSDFVKFGLISKQKVYFLLLNYAFYITIF